MRTEFRNDLFRGKMEKVGRNDPCPCGSGKKYKKCCALKQTSSRTRLKDKVITPMGSSDLSKLFSQNASKPTVEKEKSSSLKDKVGSKETINSSQVKPNKEEKSENNPSDQKKDES